MRTRSPGSSPSEGNGSRYAPSNDGNPDDGDSNDDALPPGAYDDDVDLDARPPSPPLHQGIKAQAAFIHKLFSSVSYPLRVSC